MSALPAEFRCPFCSSRCGPDDVICGHCKGNLPPRPPGAAGKLDVGLEREEARVTKRQGAAR